MVQSLQLGPPASSQASMRRLNRLPIAFVIGVVVVFLGVVIVGLSWRGLSFHHGDDLNGISDASARSFGDQLKRGVSDGIIGEPPDRETVPAPTIAAPKIEKPVAVRDAGPLSPEPRESRFETEADWEARLRREQKEQYLRENQRQRMARLQARSTALDSPLKVDISEIGKQAEAPLAGPSSTGSAPDLYMAAMKAGVLSQATDPTGQVSKEDFFNQDIRDLGYLPNQVVPPLSQNELKRGSVIPATLITGINSDLPGRITAQVSQNVYDSATGHRLLIPQGAKLFGRYDSKLSFGQERVLVVWTDLIFPNGSTLQIGGMAGTDAEGYGGFRDKVDRHLWRTFGSAALVALIGTGIDMAIPESSTLATQDTASDAARRNFAESFGRVTEQTISKNLNTQPTIRVQPGYRFNVLVDQDIAFPSIYPKS
ncbi:conjugal transfer protein TrbI [Rhizobium sp. Root708]|uniref:IncP-type conjugal transfer protein TrbI n=1 Tax=Rhizobium sp. Root708 TaxID=1736592 RepID=UPI0006FE9A18|nr:IncP-type conjugal transfer protein TrbI [Rhizobium sp. Root708]KRB49186.1 conjugal transfer protein TrbI [Rhizobium sp. Root708]